MGGLVDGILEMLSHMRKGTDAFPEGGGALTHSELPKISTLRDRAGFGWPEEGNPWDDLADRPNPTNLNASGSDYNPQDMDLMANDPKEYGNNRVQFGQLGQGVANDYMNISGAAKRNKESINIPNPRPEKGSIEELLASMGPINSRTMAPPNVAKKFRDIRNDPANENISLPNDDLIPVAPGVDAPPANSLESLKPDQILHKQNDAAVEDINNRYGTRFVSAATDEGYKQLDESLAQLGITIANPNHPLENTFKALGNNKLTIARDMNTGGPDIGGLFFRDPKNKDVIGIGIPNEIVNNQNKSLAHEWWHYFDNWMYNEYGMISKHPFASGAGSSGGIDHVTSDPMRPEVRTAWRELHNLINDPTSLMHRNSTDDDLNNFRSYWSTSHEKSARLFEEWAATKWQQTDPGANSKNPFTITSDKMSALPKDSLLAEDLSTYATNNKRVTGTGYKDFDYKQKVFAAFDKFFETLRPEEAVDAAGKLYWRLAGLGAAGAVGATALSGQAKAQAPDMTYQYNTKLSPADETKFQKWLTDNNRTQDLADYDMRGWWKENGKQSENGHFTDQFKKPSHPTFSTDSQYNGKDGYQGGEWKQIGPNWQFKVGPTNQKFRSKEDLQKYWAHGEGEGTLIDDRPPAVLHDGSNPLAQFSSDAYDPLDIPAIANRSYVANHGVPLFTPNRSLTNSNLEDAINQASLRHGISSDGLRRTAMIESSFGRNKNISSAGARGSFQFTGDTAKQYNLSNPDDDYESADAAARLWLDNKNALQRGLGYTPTDAQVYLAHQQGAAGAMKLFNSPNERAGKLVGYSHIIQNGGRATMTAQEFIDMWTRKFNSIDGIQHESTGPTTGPMAHSSDKAVAGGIAKEQPVSQADIDFAKKNNILYGTGFEETAKKNEDDFTATWLLANKSALMSIGFDPTKLNINTTMEKLDAGEYDPATGEAGIVPSKPGTNRFNPTTAAHEFGHKGYDEIAHDKIAGDVMGVNWSDRVLRDPDEPDYETERKYGIKQNTPFSLNSTLIWWRTKAPPNAQETLVRYLHHKVEGSEPAPWELQEWPLLKDKEFIEHINNLEAAAARYIAQKRPGGPR